MPNMSPETTDRLMEAVEIICRHRPDRVDEAAKLIRAVRVGSPMVASRYRLLLDNAAPLTSIPRGDQAVLAEVMQELESGQPVRREVVRVRLTVEQYDEVNAAAQAAGMNISEYIRSRLFG